MHNVTTYLETGEHPSFKRMRVLTAVGEESADTRVFIETFGKRGIPIANAYALGCCYQLHKINQVEKPWDDPQIRTTIDHNAKLHYRSLSCACKWPDRHSYRHIASWSDQVQKYMDSHPSHFLFTFLQLQEQISALYRAKTALREALLGEIEERVLPTEEDKYYKLSELRAILLEDDEKAEKANLATLAALRAKIDEMLPGEKKKELPPVINAPVAPEIHSAHVPEETAAVESASEQPPPKIDPIESPSPLVVASALTTIDPAELVDPALSKTDRTEPVAISRVTKAKSYKLLVFSITISVCVVAFIIFQCKKLGES